MFLKILGALAALGLGIWLGLPGRYSQDIRDIEEIMDRGGRRRRFTRVYFTPLAWLQRRVTQGSRRRGHTGRFRMESRDDGKD